MQYADIARNVDDGIAGNADKPPYIYKKQKNVTNVESKVPFLLKELAPDLPALLHYNKRLFIMSHLHYT